LTFYTGVTTLGDANAGAGGAGAINLANLGVNSIDLFGDATMAGAIAITKAGNNFALDIGSADAGGFAIAVTSTTPGSAFVENISIGENDTPDGAGPAAGEYSAVGLMTLTGFGTDNIASIGGGKAGVNFNSINGLVAIDVIAAPVTVAVSGNAELHLLANGAALPPAFAGTQFAGGGASFSLVEFGNGTFFTDTDTAIVRFDGAVHVNSIIATTSGGLVMNAYDTSNNGIVGDLITGSATAANFLARSGGNDLITMGAGGGTVITEDGGDTVNLGAHGPGDLVDLFIAFNGAPNNAPVYGVTYVGGMIGGWGPGGDVATGGAWGVVPNTVLATSFLDLTTLAAGTGVSTDQTVVSGFNVATDAVEFSESMWAANGTFQGLTDANNVHLAGGTAVKIESILSGGTLGGGTNIHANITELTDGAFVLNTAANVATAIQNQAYALFVTAAGGAGTQQSELIAYQDQKGNTHIADMNIQWQAAPTTELGGAGSHIVVSDIVQLTGVPLVALTGALAAANIHLLA